jgi:hypothetical protein
MPRALLVGLLLLVLPAYGADAALSVEVPAGKSRSIRLRNLPAGTALAVRVMASGKVLVGVASEKQIRSRAPDSAAPLFRAAVKRRITFKVTIPETGNYFVILSNRGGSTPVKVETEIRAVAPSRKPAPRKGDKMEDASGARALLAAA